jgi:Ig-like domain-containing protein/carboxypeptidase family protein
MVGEIKNTLRALSMFILLVVLMSINQPALASPSSVDQDDMQMVDRTRPEFRNILQGQTTIGVGITPAIISTGEMATVTVNLNNVPVEGFTSIEVTCTYYPDLVEARDIVVGDLFGADPVVAIQGPQSDHFVAAIAGSHSRKATSSGALLTFHVIGLQPGLFPITCHAQVSSGDQALTSLGSMSNDLHVYSPTSTPKTNLCDSAEFIADITIPSGTVMASGTAFTKTWRLMNVGTCTWTQAYRLVFLSGTSMSAVSPVNFPISVSPGQTVDISINMTAPVAASSYTGNWMFENANGVLFGVGPLANEPFSVNIIVSDATFTPTPPSLPTNTLIPTQSPIPGWLTFTNSTFGFQFQYPPQGEIQVGSTDALARINNLPIVETPYPNADKYLVVFAGKNTPECNIQLLQTYGVFQDPGVIVIDLDEIVIINDIEFRRQTGILDDPDVVLRVPVVSYSTLRNGVCVSFVFIMQLIHDYQNLAETAIFDQILGTFIGLPQVQTATPAVSATPEFTATPTALPTLTVTAAPTMFMSPTPSGGNGAITGQVTAGKPVTINVYDSNSTLIATAQTQPDGSFHFEVPPGNYTVTASSAGFLQAQANVASLNAGVTRILPTITLLTGDIDGNNIIDQFDALTIGMNYNGSTPSAADLNNDGIINVLDLELLAENYRDTGPTVWQ